MLGNIITYIPPRISGDRPHVPPNFPVMPAGLPVEVIAKVPSRYYRVPRYFFTVLTVAHNRWYRPTLIGTDLDDLVRYMSSSVRPSVCLSSVTFVQPTQAIG